jgi:hypothetical protein
MYRPLYISFLSWVDVNKVEWDSFKHNINSSLYFASNRDNIHWRILYRDDREKHIPCHKSCNDNGNANIVYSDFEFEYVNRFSASFTLSFLVDNITDFDMDAIMTGVHATEFVIYYLQHYGTFLTNEQWGILSQNYFAINLLVLNEHKINWDRLSLNQHWKAIELLERNPDKINWRYLSRNSGAIRILEKNRDKIDWSFLSNNKNAIHILEKNQDKIDWTYLSKNPSAISLLRNNQDKIVWKEFSMNPSIVKSVVDYDVIKKNMDIIREELLSKTMHPRRLQRWIDMGGNIDDF